MRDEAKVYAPEWGIGYDQGLEDRADELMGWPKPTTWVQDHRNQLALLDSFFSGLKPGRSLALVYVKDLPVVEERPPGFRALVGAGLVDSVGGSQEWDYDDGQRPLRSIFWERPVGHTIRADFSNGFLLPYHALLTNPALLGEDLMPFVAATPGEHFDEFSYVTERVSHDGAIAALVELARVVDLLPGVADGPWDSVAGWLSDRIADAWVLRGPYPGLGAALAAAGLERGGLIAHRVIESLGDPGADPWPRLAEAMATSGSGPAAGLVGRMARKAWDRVRGDEERFALLKLIARFPMTTTQARRMFDQATRADSGLAISDRELLENPYVLFEADRGRVDSLSFRLIDRGLFPRDAAATRVLDADPLADPITEAGDDRRVRAACTELLELAADEGHSLLDEARLRKRLAQLELDPKCDPATGVFDIAAEEFPPVLLPQALASGRDRGWQLARLAQASDLISAEIERRLARGPIDTIWDWRAEIDIAIDEPLDESDTDEVAARTEKGVALEVLSRSRIAALVGPAGTGKTTMLKALCSHPEVANRGVLLLAPTGKARVQLGDKVGAPAKTLAQFLRTSGRWHDEFGYRVLPGAPPESGAATVVVDEASMLTEEMLAALISALSGVDRLVLCGDHRQLPPIGAGRPFVDIVQHLRSLALADSRSGGGVAELTIGRRQRAGAETTVSGRDDLAIASLFSTDGTSPAADEALARVLGNGGDGTITINTWADEEELHQKVFDFLVEDPNLAIKAGDADDLRRSLGADGDYKGRPSFVFGEGGAGAERWQILSPVRTRPGGVKGLNELIRRKWRAGDLSAAIRSYKLPPPLGPDQVLFFDKVMCTANHYRDAWQVTAREKLKRQSVANGEIGMAVTWQTNKCIKIEFSTQPGLQFTFWTSELNSDSDRADVLEQAYAITVHKSQGSQFETTVVVIPNPCQLLSPELIYTALTRQRDRVVVFLQGDVAELRHLASPSRSETARRLTRLFRPADPFETLDGEVVDGSHVHRTLNDELVRSKSEVIVANTVRGLGIGYVYEQELVMKDGSRRLPDFTLSLAGKPPVYWEHLGMLESAGYRADWEAKKRWYADHDVLPLEAGGGSAGTLIWSTESQKHGIDSIEIERIANDILRFSTV